MTQLKQAQFWRTTFSLMLILFGFVMLFNTLDILGNVSDIALAAVFGLGAIAGFRHYRHNRSQWWLLIPSSVFMGLAGVLIIDAIPFLGRRIDDGTFMLSSVAFGFWAIFIAERRQRWAIFPAGLFTAAAVMSSMEHPETFIALIFAAAALFGIRHYHQNRQNWWVLFPSSALLGVSGILATEPLRVIDDGTIMLLALSLGFWVLYLSQPRHYWAAVPAGFLTTLGLFVSLEHLFLGDFEATFILMGFGLSFGMLWVRRHIDGTDWAKWPAGLLVGIGLLVPASAATPIVWPLLLIGTGVWSMRKNLHQLRSGGTDIAA